MRCWEGLLRPGTSRPRRVLLFDARRWRAGVRSSGTILPNKQPGDADAGQRFGIEWVAQLQCRKGEAYRLPSLCDCEAGRAPPFEHGSFNGEGAPLAALEEESMLPQE